MLGHKSCSLLLGHNTLAKRYNLTEIVLRADLLRRASIVSSHKHHENGGVPGKPIQLIIHTPKEKRKKKWNKSYSGRLNSRGTSEKHLPRFCICHAQQRGHECCGSKDNDG